MKISKKPANVFVLNLICDCEKGEMIYKSSSEKGHLHVCNNKECSKSVEIDRVFPSNEVEILENSTREVILQASSKDETESKE